MAIEPNPDFDSHDIIGDMVDLVNELNADDEANNLQISAVHAKVQSQLLIVIATELVKLREFIQDRS